MYKREMEKNARGENNNKKGKRQKTGSDRDRGGGRSTYCVSYLGLSVLADRIEVFSINANHSHRQRIITALCQESSPSIHSSHPLLWRHPALYLSTHHPEFPPFIFFSPSTICLLSFSTSFFPFSPSFSLFSPFFPSLPLYLPLFYRLALWKTRWSASRTRQQEFYI